MATAMYALGREKFLSGDLDWDADDFRVILIDSDDYAENLAADEFLDDIAGAAREEVSGALAGKTTTNGVADANDITFAAAAGDPCEALVIYQHTGVDATSALVAFIDNCAEFPIILNGGDINCTWDNGANKIFML